VFYGMDNKILALNFGVKVKKSTFGWSLPI
jgi:hypothetical protein